MSRLMLLRIAIVAGLFAGPAAAQPQQRANPVPVIDKDASVEIIARPVRNGLADVQYLEMRQVFRRAPGTTATDFTVRTPDAIKRGDRLTSRTSLIAMTDAQGTIPLQITETERRSFPGSGSTLWRAKRPVTFPVTVEYIVPPWAIGTPANPTYMVRSVDGGVSAAGAGMFLSANDGVTYDGRFRWDLSELPAGSVTASGLTDDVDIRAPLSKLNGTYFLAGPLHRYPASGERSGFAAYWQGTPRWDADTVMAWTATMWEYQRKFFRDTGPRRFRVLGRMYPAPAYGGAAPDGQFMFNSPSGPRDPNDPGPLLLLTHEMGHQFVRGLQNPGRRADLWFSEGLNDYYAKSIGLRSGLVPLNLVLDGINEQTRKYYTNPSRNMTADAIAKDVWGGPGVRDISYEKGVLFWADMDARIRKASKGRLTLDSVVIPMMARARAATPSEDDDDVRNTRQAGTFTTAELVSALKKAGGPDAVERFEAVMIRGETLIPMPNAFGPCFKLKSARLPANYRGSQASEQASTNETIDGYQWELARDVPEDRCRNW